MFTVIEGGGGKAPPPERERAIRLMKSFAREILRSLAVSDPNGPADRACDAFVRIIDVWSRNPQAIDLDDVVKSAVFEIADQLRSQDRFDRAVRQVARSGAGYLAELTATDQLSGSRRNKREGELIDAAEHLEEMRNETRRETLAAIRAARPAAKGRRRKSGKPKRKPIVL